MEQLLLMFGKIMLNKSRRMNQNIFMQIIQKIRRMSMNFNDRDLSIIARKIFVLKLGVIWENALFFTQNLLILVTWMIINNRFLHCYPFKPFQEQIFYISVNNKLNFH